MRDIKKILVATDFSECSDEAFRYALSLARKLQARILLIHVINEPVDLRGFYVPHLSFEKLEEEILEGARKMMDKFCRRHIQDFEDYETAIVAGIPYDVIISKSQDAGADMVVMGTHGRKGLDHMLFGSTAEKVVRRSSIPVLTIRTAE